MSRTSTEVGRTARDRFAWSIFHNKVAESDYPCVGARSVLHRQRVTVRGYRSLGGKESTGPLLADLADFSEKLDLTEGFASFVAVFCDDTEYDEIAFEERLWQQLQALRDIDPVPPDPQVSAEPGDAHFAFSAAGRAYFVIGMHQGASRPARRSARPMLVFNPHEQFEMLRAAGKFDRMRDINRARDREIAGSINPMVADHGDASEALQYSGRRVGADWSAPFDPHPSGTSR